MKLTRRDFLKAAGGAVAGGMALPALARKAEAAGTAVVVRVESPRAVKDGKPDPQVVRAMLERGLVELTRNRSPAAAILKFVTPRDVIGLKINCLGRPHLYTHHELVRAMTDLLLRAGVPRPNVIVWDRFKRHMLDCGYEMQENPRDVRVLHGSALDREHVMNTPSYPGLSAPLYRLFTRDTTCTINMPLLKTHGSPGFTLCLKNLGFGVFKHHEKAHNSGADPYIAEACAMPIVREKVRLHVLDALRGCFDGGPKPRPDQMWEEKAIYLGLDPVAIDTVCAQIIDEKRKEKGLRPKWRQAKHIRTAERLGLGCAQLSKIALKRVIV